MRTGLGIVGLLTGRVITTDGFIVAKDDLDFRSKRVAMRAAIVCMPFRV